MRAAANRGVVVQLVVVFGVAGGSYLGSAAIKRSAHVDSGQKAVGHLIRFLVIQLKMRLVDHLGAKNGRFDELYLLGRIQSVIAGRQKTQIARALVVKIVAVVGVARGERIVLAELIIKPRADLKTGLGSVEDAVERRDGERTWTYVEAVDDVSVVNVAILHIHNERRLLAEGVAERPAEVPLQERCFLLGVWVARIPDGIAEVDVDVPVQLVSARLGEDLDTSVSQLVVLGRKRVLIDTDLADGVFARHLATCKSVNIDLPAARSRRWSGQRLQIGL